MRQFLGLLAFALPSTIVWYALGSLLTYKLRLTKATKIVGFFVAWLVTPIAAQLIVDKPTVFSAEHEMNYASAISVIVVIALLWITRIVRANITDKTLKSESKHDNSGIKSQPIDNESYSDEKYYSIALKEIQVNHLSSGLWGKALAYSDGDQDKAKAYYLKERVKQLMQMHQERLTKSTETFTPIIDVDRSPILTPIQLFFVIILAIFTFAGAINYFMANDQSSFESGNTGTQQDSTSSINSTNDIALTDKFLYDNYRSCLSHKLKDVDISKANLGIARQAFEEDCRKEFCVEKREVTEDEYKSCISQKHISCESGPEIVAKKAKEREIKRAEIDSSSLSYPVKKFVYGNEYTLPEEKEREIDEAVYLFDCNSLRAEEYCREKKYNDSTCPLFYKH